MRVAVKTQEGAQLLTGGEAVAYAMAQIDPDVFPVYPITPQTPIIQTFAKLVANGRATTEIVNVESEPPAMSATIGSALAGARQCRADRRAHGGVLGLDVDDLGRGLAVGDQLGEGLDDRRLRRDRVDGEDVWIDLRHRVGNGLAAGQKLGSFLRLNCHSHHSSSPSARGSRSPRAPSR